MAPDDRDNGRYDSATDINTDPKFLNDPDTGDRVLGEGVDVKLDDLTGFSKNLDSIAMNFNGLAHAVTGPMNGMIKAAFPAGKRHGLVWTGYFHRLASHNAGAIETFFGEIGIGVRNVAMAAQAVANAYTTTDATGAARFNTILFAFGDESHTPASLKPYMDKIPTWSEFQRENPGAGVVIPENGIPPENIKITEEGGVKTMVITLPNGGGEVKIVTSAWSTYPGGPSGQTETVYVNGKKTESTSSTTVGSTTTNTTTTSVYDKDGKHVRDQVTSEEKETVRAQGTDIVTDTERRSYTYDSEGKRVDENSTQSSTAVGLEAPPEDPLEPGEDPYAKEMEKFKPDEDEPVILAPGEFGTSAPPPSTGTV